MKRLDNVANICVIAAALVFLAFVGRLEYQNHFATDPQLRSILGRTISLPGVQFSGSHKTLLIAISTGCHFCRESEPFYRQLVQQANGRVSIVAVLPQPIVDAKTYVSESIAPSIQVVSHALDSLGVTGTPTLMLVDSSGKVEKAWMGKLGEREQADVEKSLM